MFSASVNQAADDLLRSRRESFELCPEENFQALRLFLNFLISRPARAAREKSLSPAFRRSRCFGVPRSFFPSLFLKSTKTCEKSTCGAQMERAPRNPHERRNRGREDGIKTREDKIKRGEGRETRSRGQRAREGLVTCKPEGRSNRLNGAI